jgi:capsular exopolysaccharide synthesis family protein
VSPRKDLDLVYGAVSGLLVGLLLAGLLEYLDKSFRDASELEGLKLGSLLAEIPRLKGLRGTDLLAAGSKDLAGLEAYASLRASLRFLDPGKPLRSILFTSPVSGDGKTTTVANLVDTLARAGEVIVGVDADLRNPKLAQSFGIPSEPGLTSVVIGAEPLGGAVRWNAGLGILPTGPLPPNPSEILGSQPMANLISALIERADRVLIDGPAVLSVSDPLTLAPLVDGVVLVLKPGSTRRDDIVETCRRLEVIGARTVGYVLNASTSRSAGTGRPHYSRRPRAAVQPPTPGDLQLLSDGSRRSG